MMTQLYLVTGSGASTISFIVMMVAMIALFYFMLIRPQQKQQKKINDMLNNLKVGDRVKTIGGLYGRIVRIKDEVVILEVGANKVEMPFSRRAIGTVEDADVENELYSDAYRRRRRKSRRFFFPPKGECLAKKAKKDYN